LNVRKANGGSIWKMVSVDDTDGLLSKARRRLHYLRVLRDLRG
jgi:hypothetical protein